MEKMKKVRKERGWEKGIHNFWGFFSLYFVIVLNSQKLPIPITIMEINERVTRKFEYINLRSGQKVIDFNFFEEKKTKNFGGRISNILIFIGTKNIF